jgi:subtilase family protein
MKYATISISLCLFLLCTQGARADAKPGFVKVMLERNHAEHGRPPAEVASRLGGQAVKAYPAYTVIRVPENRRQEVGAVARGAGFYATIQDDWDKVLTPGHVIDTRAPRLPDSGVLSGYPGGEGLYVLQFEAPLDDEWTAEIEKAGLLYVSYLPYNAVLVYGSQSAVARAAALPQIQWSSLYHPAFRARPVDLPSSDRVERYVVQLVDVPDSQAVIEELREESQTEEVVAPYGPYLNVTVEVHPELLRRLIEDPRVVAIERDGQWMTSGEREAVAATGNNLNEAVFQDGVQPYKNTGDYKTWLAQRGIEPFLLNGELIAIADQGLAGGSIYSMNPEFWYSSVFGKAYCSGTSWADIGGHGTMVTGLAAGDGSTYSQGTQDFKGGSYFFWGAGLAPGAGVYAQRIWSGGALCPSTVATWAQDAITEKNNRGYHSVVQNHSYNDYTTNAACVQTANGVYTTKSQEYDYAVRDTGLPITVSAGNTCQYSISGCGRPCPSMVLPPATAKNVVSVGASEAYRPGMAPPCDHQTQTSRQAEDYWASSFKRVAYVSRRGTTDGRIKPDIVAPASMVSSTIRNDLFKPFCKKPNPALAPNQNENGFYSIDTGTSFAAPQAAGAIAAVNAYWNRSAMPALSPAAAKAVLVGSSISLKGGVDDLTSTTIAARPNAPQGFGRLNLDKATLSGLIQGYLDESSWTSFTGAGQTTSRTLTVYDPSKATIIVLAWSDEPAAAQAATTLVRDLNLEVRLPGNCTIYVGNKLSSTTEYSLPGASCGAKQPPDTKNNVEMIVIPPNTATTFTVHVTAATWGGTVPQKFAVFHYNAYP